MGLQVDWSRWYLTDEDDMGEGVEQGEIIRLVICCLKELARERGWENVLVAGDQFFAWVPSEPLVRVSPDVYLLDDPPPPPWPPSWQTWLPGHRAPRVAIEIVSSDGWQKDYDEGPAKYAQLGTSELVIFDPDAVLGETRERGRTPLTVYRREPDGAFVRVYAGAGPAGSVELSAWFVAVSDGKVARIRVARDEAGRDLVPTADEARKVAESSRDEERRAREVAEREVERLRAELDRLRRG
ncbi:MAG: Uma2 family endonuclease [Candidatus Riflebacteria bacterium]|nr:Uma2 family endonuclease [Candidatus Riflebacteria bacterium]